MAVYYFGGGPGWRAGGSLPGTGRRPVVTYALLAINLVVWLAMEFEGRSRGGSESPEVLLQFGAMFGPLIASGEYWRLFTAMFLHVGILHLAFNAFGLLIFGRLVEGIYGPVRFALIYLLAGLFGSVASYLLNSIAIGAGASGAIFGVLGALAAFFLARREMLGEMGRQNLTGLAVIAAFNLIFGFTQPGIDNWAHMGGLAGGFAIGMALAPNYRRVDDVFGLGGRVVDVNSLARSFWVVPVAVVLLFGGTALGNSRMPDAQSHIESAERHRLNGDREATLRELRAAIEAATRTGDTEALTRALAVLRSLGR
ncbi:MAG: rhomboid family intramembrane serine protease [Chloroflexi bacterium]|nr:rhomboid family intramembrane serine protease [Chloroflexota bacterium]